MENREVILFISKESATYHYTIRQVEDACSQAQLKACTHHLKIIHIEDDAEAAERFNIEALPTLIVGERRFVGTPNAEIVEKLVALMMSKTNSYKEAESGE
jgi:hypothetical protein